MSTNPLPVGPSPISARPARRVIRLCLSMLIFGSGVIVGAVGGATAMRDHLVAIARHPEQIPERILPRLKSQINLSEDQLSRVEEIVRRRHAAMEAIRSDSHPRLMNEFQGMTDEVAAVLDSDQRDRWSRLIHSVQDRFLPPAPHGPPPEDMLFQRFDANQDGALTEEEVPPMVWQRLRQADSNHDGKVTREEFKTKRSALVPREP